MCTAGVQSPAKKGRSLQEAQENDQPNLLEEAYQRYRAELRQLFARKLWDPQSVDDLIQTMYLSLKKNRPADGVRDPRQYLFGIAWHLLHDANRRIATERSHSVGCNFADFDAHAERSNTLWVEDDTSWEYHRAELEHMLAQLPAAWQVAVLRQYRDNRSYAEIAEELGVTSHAVKKYIMRALNHLRMHFKTLELDTRQPGKRR
jgi:RNA polymerase sigma factor (sigma-70 family)